MNFQRATKPVAIFGATTCNTIVEEVANPGIEPVTTRLKLPVGVEEDVEIDSVAPQAGAHTTGESDAVAPAGSFDEMARDKPDPEESEVVMASVVDAPCANERDVELSEIEKAAAAVVTV